MKITIGLRGNSDVVTGVIIKFDNLTLVTSDSIFLIGEENRSNMGKDLVSLLNALTTNSEITIGPQVCSGIERELKLEEGALDKWKTSS